MKTLMLVAAIFGLVGVGLIAGSGRALHSTRSFLDRATTAEGTVVRLVRKVDSDGYDTFAPVVSFRVKGSERTFTSSTSARPAAYQPGEAVTVLYDPANPADARIRSFSELYLLPLILFGIGLPFTGLGVGLLVWQRRKAQAREWLKLNGLRRQAAFVEVRHDTSVRVNGRSPYRIACEFKLSNGTTRSYQSDMLWRDPTPLLKGPTVEVLVDPNDERRYWVDTSFLPPEAS